MENSNTYATSEAAKGLHFVDGFDPTKYLSTLTEGERTFQYLEAMNRILWFRLAYPNGKIDKVIRHFTENYAVVEARVYYSKDDPEDQYISKGMGCRFKGDDPRYGERFLECAETAAVSRALADAGFGSQFCAAPGEREDGLADSGVKIPQPEPMPTADAEQPPATMPPSSAPGPEQPPSSNGQPSGPAQPAAPKQPPVMPSVEEIMATMTLEAALQTPIKQQGKDTTMGAVSKSTPGSLNWYLTEYKGPNNYARAAAQVLLNAAMADQEAG